MIVSFATKMPISKIITGSLQHSVKPSVVENPISKELSCGLNNGEEKLISIFVIPMFILLDLIFLQ
jgi:hypothetical protein